MISINVSLLNGRHLGWSYCWAKLWALTLSGLNVVRLGCNDQFVTVDVLNGDLTNQYVTVTIVIK